MEVSAQPLSEGYETWRPHQRGIVQAVVDMLPRSAVALNAPTGTGKSLTAVEAAKALRSIYPASRAVVLTGTKTLQDQYTGDFKDVVDFRGKGNYPCPLLEQHGLEDEGPRPCNSGWYQILNPTEEGDPGDQGPCPVRVSGECPYYRQRSKFLAEGSITITNYSNYLVLKGLQKEEPDLLVCDEGHNIPSVIEGLSSIAMTPQLLRTLFEDSVTLEEPGVPEDFRIFGDATQSDRWEDWYPLFQKLASYLRDEVDHYSATPRGNLDRDALRRWSRIEDLQSKLGVSMRFGGMLPTFEVDANSRRVKNPAEKKGHWQFAPVLPGLQAPSLLYGGSQRVLVMSATLPDHSLPQMGLGQPMGDRNTDVRPTSYIPMPAMFPPENSPICYGFPRSLPLTKEFKSRDESNPEASREWVEKAVDAPLAYAEERGMRALVIVSSHNQIKLIQQYSSYARDRRLFWHIWQGQGREKKASLDAFKAHKGWGALIAATDIAEGYSFERDQVTCTIIAKLPLLWPTRTPMYAARSAIIRDYCQQEMALWLSQAVGRGTRTPTDTNLIILTDNRKQGWIGQVERYLPPHVREQLTTTFPGE